MSTQPDLLGLQSAEFEAPTEERIRRGLMNPQAKASPGAMQLGAINKITQTRIRWAMAELTALNLEKVSKWLDDLAADSPKAALEIMLELVKFSTPQQKSMTVEGAPAEGNMQQLTLAQLQGLVFRQVAEEDGVVSTQ